MATPAEVLCKGYPMEFITYLNYCRALRFEDRPDYAYLRCLFQDLFVREGFDSDSLFDWTSARSSSSVQQNAECKGGGQARRRQRSSGVERQRTRHQAEAAIEPSRRVQLNPATYGESNMSAVPTYAPGGAPRYGSKDAAGGGMTPKDAAAEMSRALPKDIPKKNPVFSLGSSADDGEACLGRRKGAAVAAAGAVAALPWSPRTLWLGRPGSPKVGAGAVHSRGAAAAGAR